MHSILDDNTYVLHGGEKLIVPHLSIYAAKIKIKQCDIPILYIQTKTINSIHIVHDEVIN